MRVKILFVCMGNICRSPSAEGVFLKRVHAEDADAHFVVDSAGTHAYHIGEPPDLRMIETAKQHGIDISAQRARQVGAADFADYDYLVAMDRQNLADLQMICPDEYRKKISLLLDFLPEVARKDVPDPYFEGGFDAVFRLIERACGAFFRAVSKNFKNH